MVSTQVERIKADIRKLGVAINRRLEEEKMVKAKNLRERQLNMIDSLHELEEAI